MNNNNYIVVRENGDVYFAGNEEYNGGYKATKLKRLSWFNNVSFVSTSNSHTAFIENNNLYIYGRDSALMKSNSVTKSRLTTEPVKVLENIFQVSSVTRSLTAALQYK